MWKDSNSSNILKKASALPVMNQLDSSTYAVLVFFFSFSFRHGWSLSSWGVLLPQPSGSIASCFPQSAILLPEFWATALVPQIPFPWALLHASLIISLSPTAVWRLLIFLMLVSYLGRQRALWPWFSSRGNSGLMRSMKDVGPPDITPSSTYVTLSCPSI